MRYLITQGPGHYGVNIRRIPDRVAYKLFTQLSPLNSSTLPYEVKKAASWLDAKTGTTIMITASCSDPDQSVGFDTGWWEQGEAVIDELLKEVK